MDNFRCAFADLPIAKIARCSCCGWHVTSFPGDPLVLGQSRNGFLDLGTIMFLSKFGKRPMQFFGLLGTLFFIIGFSSSVYLIIAKFVATDFALTNRPSFYIALATMVIGMQLFLTGFIAELVARNSPERNSYLVEKKLGI